jgi:hypothetical protein
MILGLDRGVAGEEAEVATRDLSGAAVVDLGLGLT